MLASEWHIHHTVDDDYPSRRQPGRRRHISARQADRIALHCWCTDERRPRRFFAGCHHSSSIARCSARAESFNDASLVISGATISGIDAHTTISSEPSATMEGSPSCAATALHRLRSRPRSKLVLPGHTLPKNVVALYVWPEGRHKAVICLESGQVWPDARAT